MTDKSGRRRKTLSEHLAERAQAAEQARASEEERRRRMLTIRQLDALPGCDCPACRRLRMTRGR